MSDLESFLKRIADEPLCRTTKSVFADWLDDHPGSVPDAGRWAMLFRDWNETFLFMDMMVTEEVHPIFLAVSLGTKERMIIRCMFDRLSWPGGLELGKGDTVLDCTFSQCTGYAITLNHRDAVAKRCVFNGNTSGNVNVRYDGSVVFNCEAFNNSSSGHLIQTVSSLNAVESPTG